MSCDQEALLQELRKRTVEVEEVSMKIDEIQNKNYELEHLISRIETYDKDLYELMRTSAKSF